MSTKIYYDDVDIAGSQPVPFVGLSTNMISHGKRHGQGNSISLEGQLTGTESTMVDNIEGLVSKFNENFKTLRIEEDGTDYMTFDNCKVESINFSESTLSRLVEYSISLSCYKNFSGTFGVLSPSEKVSFSENDDKTVNLTHEISAKGFSTSSSYNNAFENAKNYVLGLTGWNPVASVTPHFINGGANVYPILLSTTESINRMDSTYSVTENYTFSTGQTTYTPVVNYSVSKDTSIEDEVTTVTVEANVKAGKNLTMNWADYASNLDLYSVATGWSETTDLLTNPVDYSVNEDTYSNTLTVRATYDNNKLFNGGNTYAEPSVSFETDNLTDITTVNITVNFFSRGSWAQQKSNIESYISGLEARTDGVIGYLHTEANSIYTSIYGSTFNLSKHCGNLTKNINDFTHQYSFTASFDNKDSFPTSSSYYNTYNQASYTIDVTPSIRKLAATPACNQNGYYLVYDTEIQPREQISFSVNTTANTSLAAVSFEKNLEGENSILEKLAGVWLTPTAVLDSENSNIDNYTRTSSATQGYTQQISAYGTNQALTNFYYLGVNSA